MATQTVCDNCEAAPLKPATGFYVLSVKKVIKDTDDGQTQSEIEYDLCGACMSAIRAAVPEIE